MDVDDDDGSTDSSVDLHSAEDILGIQLANILVQKDLRLSNTHSKAMQMSFVEFLHQKALIWEATGVSFDKAVPQIQRIIDRQMSPDEVLKFTAAWTMLRQYGNQACDNAAMDGTTIVDGAISWRRTSTADIDWNYVLRTIGWIQAAQREIRDMELREGVLFSLHSSPMPCSM